MSDREATVLLYTAGPYTVRPIQRPRGGYVVCKDGATHATVVATFGAGLDYFERAKREADRRYAADSLEGL